MERRRNIAIAVVAVGVLALASILALTVTSTRGGVLEGVEPVTAIRAAPQKLEGKRLRASFTFGTGGALQIQVAQEGVFDLSAQRADVVVTGLGSGRVRIVSDGSTLFVQAAKPLGGRPWGKLDAAQAGPLSGGVGQVSGTQIRGLIQLLGSVRAANDMGVEKLGERDVRHLSSTVSAAELAGLSPLFTQAGIQSDAALDVYLDKDGNPRRVIVAAEAGATKVQLAVTISEIGGPGPVQSPPADETATISFDDLTTVLRG